MAPPIDRLGTFLKNQQRALASVIAAVLVFNGLLAVSRGLDPNETTDLAGTPGLVSEDGTLLPDGTIVLPDGTIIPSPQGAASALPTVGGTRGKKPGKKIDDVITGTLPPGVTDDEILIVYYWKGERTMTSPYVGDTPAEGHNLDEGLAFRRYVEYINKHDGDGTKIMGVPIDLHGRKLRGIVLEAGNGDFSYGKTAERIAKEIRPFAAIAAHGSLSTYMCPTLADAGIHNMQTYDLGGLGGTLIERTDGHCIPSGLAWERQVDLTIGYLKKHMDTPTTFGAERVYGVIWSAYDGLKDIAKDMIAELKAAGIPIAADAKLPADLATSQQQAPILIGKMRDAGVNTLIMPEGGSPINITHAAEANQYRPDYYIWPCSGQDTTGMVRLFNGAQWDRAEGLTCYDYELNPDITNNDKARQTEWYKAYQEVAPGKEPPSPGPFVYMGLWETVAGISMAGPELTVESFRAGLDAIEPYRYDAIDGRTTDRSNMLLDIGSPDRSVLGDVGYLYWSTTARESGGAGQGAYVYPEDRRYSKRSQF